MRRRAARRDAVVAGEVVAADEGGGVGRRWREAGGAAGEEARAAMVAGGEVLGGGARARGAGRLGHPVRGGDELGPRGPDLGSAGRRARGEVGQQVARAEWRGTAAGRRGMIRLAGGRWLRGGGHVRRGGSFVRWREAEEG